MGPIQFAVCYGAVVGMALLGGQSMKVPNYDPNFFKIYKLKLKNEVLHM